MIQGVDSRLMTNKVVATAGNVTFKPFLIVYLDHDSFLLGGFVDRKTLSLIHVNTKIST